VEAGQERRGPRALEKMVDLKEAKLSPVKPKPVFVEFDKAQGIHFEAASESEANES